MAMKKRRVPPLKKENADILRYIVMKYVWRAILTLLLYALFAFATVWYPINSSSGAVVAVCLVCAITAFAYFAIWRKLLSEKDICGVLVEKGFRKEKELTRGPISAAEVRAYNSESGGKSLEKDVVYFFIDTGNGETEKKRLYDDGIMSRLFFDGDTVCFRRGLKFPCNLSAVRQGQYICVICGNVLPDTETHCPRCRHSLIRLEGHTPTFTPEEDGGEE